jgi:hypothetical protein
MRASIDPPPNAAPSIREGKVMPPQNPDLEGTTPIPVWFVGNTETIQKPAYGKPMLFWVHRGLTGEPPGLSL